MNRHLISKLLALASIALVVLMPFTGASIFWLNIVSFVLINLTVVSGLIVLYGHCDRVSLAQGALFGIGAYTMGVFTLKLGLSPYLGLVAATIISFLFGILISLPALRLKGHYLAMGTLAFGELAVWVFTEAAPLTGGVDGMGGITTFSSSPTVSYFVVAAVALLVLLGTKNLISGVPGDCMQGLADSEHGARACGVPIESIEMRAYIFSACTAGIGGALYAGLIGFISPALFGIPTAILFLAMAVIGGRNSFAGPIIATIALTLVSYSSSILPLPNESVRSFISGIQVDLYALAIIGITIYQARSKRKRGEG